MRFLFLFIFLFTPYIYASSQNENPDWWDSLEDWNGEEEAREDLLEDIIIDFDYLTLPPVNLQNISKKELEQFPFLSDDQIEAILYYIYKYAPLSELSELKNIPELDRQTLSRLLPFVYLENKQEEAEKIDFQRLLKYGKQEFILRNSYTLQKKEGYRNTSSEHSYLGEPYYLSFRYHYEYKDRIRLGIVGEKDAGEVFLSPKTKGFDHYSFSLKIENIIGLNKLYIGDYKLYFGEGLALNNNFGLGKIAFSADLNRRTPGIRQHISTNEVDFFRGIAGMTKINSFRFFLFYSLRNLDARSEGNRIYSFKTDGYNRTHNDLLKRNTAQVNLLGGHIDYKTHSLQLGFTAVYYSFGNKFLNPEPTLSNTYHLRAKNHFNTSVDYRYKKDKILLQGEIAIDANAKTATLNHLLWTPSSKIDFFLTFRYYDKAYNALYARSFSEKSKLNNEQGVYTGIKWRPMRRFELFSYLDVFHSPWYIPETETHSSGKDYFIKLSYFPNKHVDMNFRYRFKEKKDKKQSWRYLLNYQYNTSISLQFQAHYNAYQNKQNRNQGWSLVSSLFYNPPSSAFRLDVSMSYFDAPEWATRISIYERNVLHAFSFPTFYGKGLRAYLNLRWNLTPSLSLYAKFSNTCYQDRNKIGTGLNEIQGNNKTDLDFSVRYRF